MPSEQDDVMDFVTIRISGKWRRFVHSPYFQVVAALTGVAVTFVPLAIFHAGRDYCSHGKAGTSMAAFWGDPSVWLLFAIVYFVPGFYMTLASEVLKTFHTSRVGCSPVIKIVSIVDGTLSFVLSDLRTIQVPLAWHPQFVTVEQSELNNWQRSITGRSIYWPGLGIRITIHELLQGTATPHKPLTFWTRPLFAREQVD